jgi:hypothetical protein
MATLTVTATHDYRSDPLTNIDSIVFATSSGATATFNSDQFGPGLISNNVAISGDAHQNVVQVVGVAPGAFSAAQWSFSNWGSSDQPSFADGVVLMGSPDAGGQDTITGSSQGDEIWASSSAFQADDGADSLSGGAGDDVFRIHRGSSYTLFDGGPGTDTIWVFSQMTDPGTVDLSNSTIVGVERLRLAASHASATLRGDQIGGPGKIQEVEGYPPGPGLNSLTVNGDHVDLSTVTFVNSGQIVHINGTSASGNTLIGSSQSDIISAFDGSSGDILDGRGGSDTLTGGSGNDRYVYASGYGADSIFGFVAGAGTPDKIDLTGVRSAHDFATVLAAATQSGADTVFNFGSGDTLTLHNIQKTALAADDFILNQSTFRLAAFAPDAGGWVNDTTYPRELADVNGDHMADIVGFGDGGVYVALATGGGAFGPSSFKLANFAPSAGGWSNDSVYPRELADVDGDGMADIVGFGESGVYVALATGGGSFGPSSFKLANFAPSAGGWSNNTAYPRELADVDGDGMADIVGFGQDGVYVALATGGGSFGPSSFRLANFAPGAGGWSNADKYPRFLADVNGDHLADIVGFGESGVYVALATGGGSFGPSSFKLANFAPSTGGWANENTYPRELADVNGDHMADIVGFGADGVYFALATGGGSFGRSSFQLENFAPNAGGWSSQDIYPRHLADVDHDGAADIVGFGQSGVYDALANGFHFV